MAGVASSAGRGAPMTEILDCAIVGAGPAGLTAAVYLGRARRQFVVLDGGDSRAAWIPTSHNCPGYPEGVTGEDLLARHRRQAETVGVRVLAAKATDLTRDAQGVFHLTTGGDDILARRVILATGVRDHEPAGPGHAGVFNAVKRGLIRLCPICDGYESSGMKIGVIGSCDHAAAEALFLRTYTDRVTVIVPEALGRVSDQRRADLAQAQIALIEARDDAVDVQGSRIGCMVIDGAEHLFDVIYAALGSHPRNALAKAAGCELAEDGRLVVDAHQQTSVEGVYAAGDLVRGLNQVAVAQGEAAIAAVAVHNSLPRNFA